MTTKLRLALLIDSFQQPLWVHRVVQDIQSSEVAEVVLVVQQALASPDGRLNGLKTLFSKRHIILWKAYEWVDRMIFSPRPDPFAGADIASLVPGVPVFRIRPRAQGVGQTFEPADVARIQDVGADVALRFGFGILKGDALRIAKHGVWSYHHGDNRVNRGGPAGAWEVLLNEPVTGSILQILTEDLDDGRVIYRSWAPTCAISVARNRANLYWKTAHFALRMLRVLHAQGPQALADDAPAGYRPYDRRLFKSPTNKEMLRLFPRLIGRVLWKAVRGIFTMDQWTFGYGFSPTPEAVRKFYGLRLLTPPRDRWWADPFPVEKDGRYFIFFEEFLRKQKKGRIAVMEMDGQGRWSPPVTALERPYHLSYPFIFDFDGNHYMVPETSDRRTVELYRCVSFPGEWVLERTLLEGIEAADATLHREQDTWWMFVSIRPAGCTTSDELSVFYADHPFGPWRPHADNPVKSDARGSRPAGRLFTWQGVLYRPAQDCTPDYGTAISIQQVTRITPTVFEEKEVSRIEPAWRRGIDRNHTFNHAGRLSVLDAYRRRVRWPR